MTRNTTSYYEGRDIVAPVQPKKPSYGVLDRNSPQSLRIEADNLEAWLGKKEIADAERRDYQVAVRERRLQLRDDLGTEHNLNPAQAALLFNIAWADGHDEGIDSVIDRFEELAETVQLVINLQDPS
jgi:hypothetical protein